MELTGSSSLQLEILAYVALAMVLGAVLGVDREIAHRPAGLRTHMMVSGAAALLVALGELIVRNFEAEQGHTLIQTDPLRVIEAVITGVSFLGAGTILRRLNSGSRELTGLPLVRVARLGVGSCVVSSNGRYCCDDTHSSPHRRRQMF
jgi:putative Mg2+ transporter-C (MgtC) family protein